MEISRNKTKNNQLKITNSKEKEKGRHTETEITKSDQRNKSKNQRYNKFNFVNYYHQMQISSDWINKTKLLELMGMFATLMIVMASPVYAHFQIH